MAHILPISLLCIMISIIIYGVVYTIIDIYKREKGRKFVKHQILDKKSLQEQQALSKKLAFGYYHLLHSSEQLHQQSVFDKKSFPPTMFEGVGTMTTLNPIYVQYLLNRKTNL